MKDLTHLAFIRLNVRVHDHVSLQSLFLDETLEAHVALVGSNVGVDEDVTLHVRQQGELTTTDAALVLLNALKNERMWRHRREKCGQQCFLKSQVNLIPLIFI